MTSTPEPETVIDRQERLRIYEIFVDSAQQVTNKRHEANRYFISAIAAIWVAYSYALTQLQSAGPLLFMVSASGAAICLVWFSSLMRFKNLNRCKYELILDIERRLVEKPFTGEDKMFYTGKRPWMAASFADIESWLAIGGFLASIYLAFMHMFPLMGL